MILGRYQVGMTSICLFHLSCVIHQALYVTVPGYWVLVEGALGCPLKTAQLWSTPQLPQVQESLQRYSMYRRACCVLGIVKPKKVWSMPSNRNSQTRIAVCLELWRMGTRHDCRESVSQIVCALIGSPGMWAWPTRWCDLSRSHRPERDVVSRWSFGVRHKQV